MKSLVYFICAYLCCIADITASPSIVEYPYFAAIEEDGNHVCSATIVDDLYVMTTNSCVAGLDVKNTRVRVGTDRLGFRGGVFKAVSIYPYPNKDVAMVKVASPFPFSSRVKPLNPNNIGIDEGQPGVLVGWTNSKRKRSPLSPSQVVVLPSANCSAAYAGVANITSNMYCLAPSDPNSHPCLADIGAPLYYNEQYYGFVVYNLGCQGNLPVLVSEVAPYTPFLIIVLSDFSMHF